jgi:Na+/serine symporter
VIILKLAEKDLNYYWKIIKYPLVAYIVWMVAGFVVSLISFSLYMSIFGSFAGYAVIILVMGIAGYTAVADHKGGIKHAAWSGALIGIIGGFIGAIISIIMAYAVPELLEMSVTAAVEQGAEAGMVEKFVMIGMYINLVLGPLIYGVIGAIISSIGGWISKLIEKH